MNKIAVISTSTGCLDYVDVPYDNLRIIRMKIIAGDETYNDYVDITADEFYQMLLDDKTLVPSSSMPAIGELLEQLEALEKEGYEQVIIVTISSELSGTYETCLTALNLYEGDMQVEVVDSLNAAISEGFISLEALRLIDEGKSMTEIIAYLHKLRTNRLQFFMVDNLRLFVANGRLSGASGFIGNLLKIKPILQVNNNGKIVSYEKVRTQKKSLTKMVELIQQGLQDIDDFIVLYNTSNNIEGLKFVKEQMEEAFPGYNYIEAPITPVIGCHTGIGTVGIAFFDLSIQKDG